MNLENFGPSQEKPRIGTAEYSINAAKEDFISILMRALNSEHPTEKEILIGDYAWSGDNDFEFAHRIDCSEEYRAFEQKVQSMGMSIQLTSVDSSEERSNENYARHGDFSDDFDYKFQHPTHVKLFLKLSLIAS